MQEKLDILVFDIKKFLRNIFYEKYLSLKFDCLVFMLGQTAVKVHIKLTNQIFLPQISY